MEEASTQHRGPLRLGSYQIVRKLTRGGMAELFLARKSDSEQLYVLKKILPKYAHSSRMVQLFQDEAKLAASLDHPNIVRVHDVGDAGRDHFFAMEYLHGQDVRTILHRAFRTGSKMPLAHAVSIARQVAAALHYAHDKRRGDGTLLDVVHRDVSPSNVIVAFDGIVKLVDFGVAKAASSTIKTRTGTLKGKIAYMSPEQARGAPLDRRSDIFSLGIVLWEMVTTQRLFRGENDLATLQLVINQPPKRPSEVAPECPPELEAIIMRALSQDVARRYQSAAELERDLAAFAQARELDQSPAALARYLSELFAAEVASWHEAQAAGVALFEHLTQVGELTTPISESEFIEAIDLDDDEPLEEEEDDDNLPSAAVAAAGSIISRSELTKPAKRDPSVPRVRATSTPRSGASHVQHETGPSALVAVPPPIPRAAEKSDPISTPIATPSGGFPVQSTPANTSRPGTPFPNADYYLRDVALLQDLAADRAAAERGPVVGPTQEQIERLYWWAYRVGAGILAMIIAIGLIAGSW